MTEETVVEAPVYTGIALSIDIEIEALKVARDVATELECGLDTKSEISLVATSLREKLLSTKKNLHCLYSATLATKNNLLSSVGEVQAKAKKAALKAQIMEMNAKLKAMK